MNLAQIWPPEMAICTYLLEISLIIEAVFPQESTSPGHVWCPGLCRISRTLGPAGCSHWNQLSGAAGGADLHRSLMGVGASPGTWWRWERRKWGCGVWRKVKDCRLGHGKQRLGLENGQAEGRGISESGWAGTAERKRLCLGDGVITLSWPPVWHSSCIVSYSLFPFTVSDTHREQFMWPILNVCLGWIMPQDCWFLCLDYKRLVRWLAQMDTSAGSDGAQPHSLQEGCQLLNPLGVLSQGQWELGIYLYHRVPIPCWHTNLLQGIPLCHSPTPQPLDAAFIPQFFPPSLPRAWPGLAGSSVPEIRCVGR